MQNSMVGFTFSGLGWKHPFWANLAQQIENVSLSWNLVPRLIGICRIQCWCSPFLFCIGNTLFYCLCNRTRVETLKQPVVVSTSFFYFTAMRTSVPWIVFEHYLKFFKNNLKPKWTFYFTWINFFRLKNYKLPNLDWTFYVKWINLFLIKRKLIIFDWIVNNLIVHNLLISYLNLIGDFGVLPPLLISVEWYFCSRASWTLNPRNITMFSSNKRPKVEDQSVYSFIYILLYINMINVCSLVSILGEKYWIIVASQ